jgi:hypothetical protein
LVAAKGALCHFLTAKLGRKVGRTGLTQLHKELNARLVASRSGIEIPRERDLRGKALPILRVG